MGKVACSAASVGLPRGITNSGFSWKMRTTKPMYFDRKYRNATASSSPTAIGGISSTDNITQNQKTTRSPREKDSEVYAANVNDTSGRRVVTGCVKHASCADAPHRPETALKCRKRHAVPLRVGSFRFGVVRLRTKRA